MHSSNIYSSLTSFAGNRIESLLSLIVIKFVLEFPIPFSIHPFSTMTLCRIPCQASSGTCIGSRQCSPRILSVCCMRMLAVCCSLSQSQLNARAFANRHRPVWKGLRFSQCLINLIHSGGSPIQNNYLQYHHHHHHHIYAHPSPSFPSPLLVLLLRFCVTLLVGVGGAEVGLTDTLYSLCHFV